MAPDTLTSEQADASATKTTYSTCYMCTTNCPITVVSQGDEIVSISHPDCVRAEGMQEQRDSDQRLVHAMVRASAADDWRQVARADAVKTVADKMLALRAEHGADAVAFMVGYTKEARPYIRRLQEAFGTPHYVTESSCCFGATYVASTVNFGEDYNHFFQASRFRQAETQCRLIWSTNPQDSLIPYGRHYLLAEANKVPTIVVDPRRTTLAEAAEIHLQNRPGTDGALAHGLAHVIFAEGLEDAEFLAAHGHGVDDYRAYVADFTPDRVSEITGVPAELIVKAAKLYGGARPAQITISQEALVQHHNGFQNHRAVMLLAALTGNLDVAGGNRPWPNRFKEKSLGLGDQSAASGTALGGEDFPVFTSIYHEGQAMKLAEFIEAGKVKAVIAVGTNVMMWPNSERMKRAFKSLDMFVVSDFFDTPTVEAATVFLPAATHLERQNLVTTLNGRVQNRPAAVAPRGEAKGDTELMFELADALGLGAVFWDGDITASFDERLKTTAFAFADLPANGKSLEVELDTIPEQGYRDGGFKTPTGKVEFASTTLAENGYDALPTYTEPYWSPVSTPDVAKDFPLVLTSGGRSNTYTHSQGRNLETLRRREPDPYLQIHPTDAAARGIDEGDWAELSSPLATIQMRARVTDRVLEGVIHAPHGWAVANVNALIPDAGLDPISGYPPFKSSLCEVRKA